MKKVSNSAVKSAVKPTSNASRAAAGKPTASSVKKSFAPSASRAVGVASIRTQLKAGGVITVDGEKRRVQSVSHDGDLIDVFFPGGKSVTFRDPGQGVGEPVLMKQQRSAINDLPIGGGTAVDDIAVTPPTKKLDMKGIKAAAERGRIAAEARKLAVQPPTKKASKTGKLNAELKLSIAKATKANGDMAVKEVVAVEAPDTPLTRLLTKAGYVYSKSALLDDDRSTAHGYSHINGSAVMFIHANTSTDVAARWVIKDKDGVEVTGKTAKELAVALIKPEPLPANVVSALDMLRKLTKGTYELSTLAGDANYKARVQLLKKLRNTEKVLSKESGVNNVVKAFYAALNIQLGKESAAAVADKFVAQCHALYKTDQKATRAVVRVEKAEVKEVLKRTGREREVHDGKPILPAVKKLSTKKQRAADEAARATLAAQITNKRKQEEYTPLAVPRPEATISVDLNDVCILEDPSNGIVMMCLEKPNSQGAICVYNNGSRVAAGVVPTEILITLRRLVSEDLVRDVNQLLHPLTAGVIVTPVAQDHLTAVLTHCKENIDMATEKILTTKKFAAPASAAKKSVAKSAKAEKPAKAAKAAKVDKAPRVTEDRKIKALVTMKSEGLPRVGSFCYGQVQAVIGSKTVSEAQAKLDKSGLNPNKRKLEVAWLTKSGFIQVSA